jgi:hypothetical protein
MFFVCIQTRGTRRNATGDFFRLHEIARHLVHSNETLGVAVETIHSISEEHKEFSAERERTSKDDRLIHFQTQRSLSNLAQDLNNIKMRSASLQERLLNEINLVRLFEK